MSAVVNLVDDHTVLALKRKKLNGNVWATVVTQTVIPVVGCVVRVWHITIRRIPLTEGVRTLS